MKQSRWVRSSVATLLLTAVLSPQAKADGCALSPRTAMSRMREVEALISSGSHALVGLQSSLGVYRQSLGAMEASVAAGRISFAISMAASTLAVGGATVALGSLATGPLSTGGIGALIVKMSTAGASAGLATVTAGMAYGTYRTFRTVDQAWVREGHLTHGEDSRPEEVAHEFLRLILEPHSAGASSVQATFAARGFNNVRNFLRAEHCGSTLTCHPTPPGFSEAWQAAEEVHRGAQRRFDATVSGWLPEVLTNREARRLAEVEIPFVENLIQQVEASQAYYAAVRTYLIDCLR